jgi:hypothetical protein
MPLGAFRQSLYLANPAGAPADNYGTYQGYFRPSSSTILNAYNTASVSQASVTHSCGTLNYIRAKRIPGTTSHIVGVSGSAASKFYRYTPGTGFVQLGSAVSVASRSCDIAFDIDLNVIYMVSTRSTTPFITLRTTELSATTSSSNILSNPSVLPTGTPQTVRYSPDGKLLAVNHAITPFLRVYTRSGDTYTTITNPTGPIAPQTGDGMQHLDWSADSTDLVHRVSTTASNQIRVSNWTGSAWSPQTLQSRNFSPTALAFNPNPLYSNILLAGAETSLFFYDLSTNSFTGTSSQNTNVEYQSYQYKWSPDGLKLAIQNSTTQVRVFNLNTSYTTSSTVSELLGGVGQIIPNAAYGFDWMYH